TVIRHRQDDDQRSSRYDELLSAETRAAKNAKGVHSRKDAPTHRISEVSGDASKAKQFLPSLQRAGRISGIVEFVASGSRLRVYLPKETCLITLLLAGIECPRMQSTGNQGHMITGEPYGEEAYNFTREHCLQKDVEIEVSACDRVGNFIGWLFIDDLNLSLSLVKEGLSGVHFSAEKSPFYSQLIMAEESAKTSKIKIWANFEETKTVEVVDDTSERQCKYEKVVITEVEGPQCFWVQHADSGTEIEQMMERLRTNLADNPPVPGSFTPRRGELCAALFTDNNWYRARVLKTSGPKEITVLYIDFGNIEVLPISKIRALPRDFASMKPQAVEYNLALVREPNDEEMKYDLNAVFKNKILNNMFLLNKEYKINNQEFVTLTNPESKEDIGRALIAEGLALVDKRNEKRFQKMVKDYLGAQDTAKKNRLNMWRYGDITEDDAKEFGYPTK
ncbi:staphylococcal nuclease domain-containing 1-like, partial [Paramuricea clavata]